MNLLNIQTGFYRRIFWILLFGAISANIFGQEKLLLDFSETSAQRKWFSVNDDVMGGISKGSFRITDDQTLEFFGDLSLENRGGFASIRTRNVDLNLGGYDRIVFRCKGDGRKYSVNLFTTSRTTASSYRAEFSTKNNTWQEVVIPMEDFRFTSYGRNVPFAGALNPATIKNLGFTLSDKKPGAFRLEIDEIRAEKDSKINLIPANEVKESAGSGKDIVDTAVAAGNFNTLVAAVQAAGLVDALKGEGPLTVFAPTDDAFAKLGDDAIAELLKPENRDKLTAILTYHVISGEIFLSVKAPATLQGQSVSIRTPGAFEINGSKIVKTDIVASNGVIHVIDKVLIPSEEKRGDPAEAKAVIEYAISQGVPLFNSGNAAGCSAIYEIAIESLLRSETNGLNDQDRSGLRKALNKARKMDADSRSKAWTLRYALDAVYEALNDR